MQTTGAAGGYDYADEKYFPQNIFKTDCSKRDFLSDQIEGVIAGRKISSPLNKKFAKEGNKNGF